MAKLNHSRSRYPLVSTASLLMLAGGTALAQSTSVPLGATTTSNGTTYFNTDPTLTLPNYTYGNTVTGTGANVAGTSSSFFDDYVFTIAASTADSVTSTINLGASQITNLQASIYSYSGGSLPLYGTTLPPGSVEEDGWSTPFSFGAYSVIAPITLQAGTYTLEVRGDVANGNSGSYSGVLDLTSVPLPAGMPLLLSGVAGLAFWGRRRLA